jgi:tagatose-6-phosphate ketose/aldose isomerase
MIQINNEALQPETNSEVHTRKEIWAQPGLWNEVYYLIGAQRTEISDFLDPILQKSNLRIIMTGAGTSGYIGDAAQGILQKIWKRPVQAVPTTEIVTQPGSFFIRSIPTLLISFARSGNSPESTETVKLADAWCNEVYHLMITCNGDGALARTDLVDPDKVYRLVLPEATNDKSLAMTSSFTSMLLSVLLVANIGKLDHEFSKVQQLIEHGNAILANQSLLQQLVLKRFERVVFLGTGELLGIARECHLKLLELTDGRQVCMSESFLAFRHGPRAFVDENTLMVYLFSRNPHVMRYERDLAEDIGQDVRSVASLQIGGVEETELRNSSRIDLDIDPENPYQMIAVTLVGQLLGYFSSIHAGLNPDSPSTTGAISRVVQGVNIYQE